MRDTLPLLVSSIFALLAVWHFYMAIAPERASRSAVPSVDDKPLFVPGRAATVAVGIGLLSFALLVCATAGLLSLGIPVRILRWLSIGLAFGLLARAVGEFRYVGFFKRYRRSRFATLDTFVYSPLCLTLSAGVVGVALRSAQ